MISVLASDSAGFFVAAFAVLAVAAAVGIIRQQVRAGADRRREAALDAYVLRQLIRGSAGSVRFFNQGRLTTATVSRDLTERS